MIDFNASACMFEIRINDNPVIAINLNGQAASQIPINNAINKRGKQEISIKMIPLLGETRFSSKAKLEYTIKLYDTSSDFDFKGTIGHGYQSKEIDKLPFVSNLDYFEARVPYDINVLWVKAPMIKDIKNYNSKIRLAYKELIKVIKNKDFNRFRDILKNREENIATSMFLSEKESRSRVEELIHDFNNGYNHLLFEEDKAIPVISAYGKKVALKTLEGKPALGYGNIELQEKIMLDIEFYYNVKTEKFEVA